MPAPLDPDKRAAIADAIREGGHRNAIAREHGVSPSTVTSIAKQEGLTDAFDRAATKEATTARSDDVASRKVALARLLLDDAFRLRERIWTEGFLGITGRGDNAQAVYGLPPGRDVQSFMVAIGIAIDKVSVLTRDESESGAAVDAWLRSLGVGATRG